VSTPTARHGPVPCQPRSPTGKDHHRQPRFWVWKNVLPLETAPFKPKPSEFYGINTDTFWCMNWRHNQGTSIGAAFVYGGRTIVNLPRTVTVRPYF